MSGWFPAYGSECHYCGQVDGYYPTQGAATASAKGMGWKRRKDPSKWVDTKDAFGWLPGGNWWVCLHCDAQWHDERRAVQKEMRMVLDRITSV